MILLGLHGRLASGKDTTFGFVQEWATERGVLAVRRGFADKLKHSALTALGFQVSADDALVLADSLKHLGEISTMIPDQSVLYTIDGRKFLQLYGTEAHRDIFGQDFWVDALLPIAGRSVTGEHTLGVPGWEDNFTERNSAGWPESADIAVVTDVRFENEAQRVLDLGGVNWEIIRTGLGRDDDVHSSEAGLHPSMINRMIVNTGTLEDLRTEVYSAMDDLYNERTAK